MSSQEEIIKTLNKKDIKDIITKNISFLVEPQILFYAKKRNRIVGYLEVNGRHYRFELIFSKDNSVSITIGELVVFGSSDLK
ncbi:hypothetical protein SIRV1gp13 [Sulfolobus islandicus rod-shaped virus 1]|uniref:Uncharacterized protein 81 n=1 Tax=Sulfolobus islandicus rod-shaped virus 1 TaxID=157898 RepID=Y81_SIRV1|nr:hypothetical protein SIRV1gp13 [Sulfolobus islandicus rod-shaped virus 1]Q8QL41.1 RecName: Full=Uncharacterized protein 81 [Sulfolobus islandicus rod-shaped virus 1]CAC93968.1 hypothetical protein [Sulfolobus islandicus rod-shaped virus 1]